MSLHGRPVERVRPLLHPGTRILALTSDGGGPAAIARLLAGRIRRFAGDGAGGAGRAGGAQQRLRRKRSGTACAALNLVAIEVEAGPEARVLTLRRASTTGSSTTTGRSASARCGR